MNTLEQVLNYVKSITETLNKWADNAKKVEELPVMESMDSESLLIVSQLVNGVRTSKQLEIQKIIDGISLSGQDNKVREFLLGTITEDEDLAYLLDNNGLMVAENEIIVLTVLDTIAGTLVQKQYLWKLGKGSFSPIGSANISQKLLELQPRFINEITADELTNSPQAIVYDFGTINNTVLEVINGASPARDYNNEEKIYYIRATKDGVNLLYNFIGINGIYGSSELQMNESDLVLVYSSQNTDITGLLQSLVSQEQLSTSLDDVYYYFEEVKLPEKADKLTTYTKEEVDSKVVGIYKFKGNKTDYADLIATTGMAVGDVYNLLSNEKNYGWTGSSWDDLGGVFDISGKEDVANKSTSVFADFLSNIKFPSVKAVYDWATSLFQTWVLGINRILGVTYTVGINDYKTKNIFSNSSPIALSVPSNTSVAIPVGAKFSYTVQGSGAVTISGAGITFIQKNLVYTTGDTFFLEKTDTDTWVVEGNVPATGAISPYTAFINTISGNNSTAVLGDSSKPFLTDVAALAALPANDGNAWDFVYLCNNVTRTIIFPTQRKIRFICKNAGTFNLNNWFGFSVSIPEIYFDAPGCNITGSVTVQSSLVPTLPVYIDVNDFTFTNTNVGGGNTFINTNSKSFISINNITCSIAGTGSLFNFGTFFINKATTNRGICNAAAEATIPELVIAGTGANFWGNSYPINKFKTKKITGTSNSVFEISGIFDVTDLETSATIDIVSYGILTGVRSANYLGILRLGFQASNVMVMNFYGKLASWTIDTSAANNLTIHDSTIFLDQFLYRTTGFSGTRTWNFRNVEIIATNVSSTLSQNPNTNALTVINKTGFIKTNGTFDAQTTFVNRTPNSY